MVRSAIEAALEGEMSEALGAEKGERTESRLGYRSGYYQRALITRVGTLELRAPQDRAGRFSTDLFERYQRSEKALVGALAEICQSASKKGSDSLSMQLRLRVALVSRRRNQRDGTCPAIVIAGPAGVCRR